MTIDCHLKLDGVQGESTHKDHKDEIAIQSWNWDVSNESSVGSGGGSGKGKARPGLFVFTHSYDKASPVLGKACAAGKHFKDAVFTCRKAGEGQKDFLKVTLKQVLVSSAKPSAMSGGDISELVQLSYEDIEFEYKAQDAKGELGGAVKFGWNISTTETR
jgi:type VI secretion system secreted protein Hcp